MGAVIFFYFFYYESLCDYEEIQQAFKTICLDKMLADGYFDMSAYINGRIKKEDMYAALSAQKSKFSVLYRNSIPKQDDAYDVWKKLMQNNTVDPDEERELQQIETVAIVNWVYRTMSNADERQKFTREIFSKIKEFHNIQNDIRFSHGVVYNAAKVDLHIISSITSFNKIVAGAKHESAVLFYRGHADANYVMRPSVMRTSKLEQSEFRIYHELQIECPEDFEKCHTHLETLVKMQHYGLPTRLLDITRNPLVALYFACESRPESYGEVILISAKEKEIKYPKSDTISLLASLAALPYERQQDFRRAAKDPRLSSEAFNDRISRLIHEVRLEKPAFRAEVRQSDVLDSFIVYALKNNNRIVKQDGAFIVCGLNVPKDTLGGFRYRENGKKVVVLIDKKEKILEELEEYSINRATLFPEIESVSAYLKSKYS